MDFLDFIRKVHKERKQRWIAKHYGPGPHPGTGTPQSVHGGKGKRGKRKGAKGETSWGRYEIKITKPFGSFAVPKGQQRALVSYTKHEFETKKQAEQWAKWLRDNPPQSIKQAIREGRYADQTKEGKAQLQRIIQGKRKQPPDMSKWSKAQHTKAINSLVKKPLKELRRRQNLIASQRKQALQQLKATKDSTIKQRLERGLRNLEVMDKHLIAAIDKKEFR